jgi:transcriptional regulator with XRE-family HTH domain
MKLAAYLEKKKMARAEFARRLAVPPSYVTMLCYDRFWPGRKTMLRILEETEGKVTPNDLLGVDVASFRGKAPPRPNRRSHGQDGEGRRKRQG